MTPASSLLTIVLLVGGILPLAIGPFLAQWAERSQATKAALDAFIAVSLGGVVILHLWPHAFLVAGGWALAGGLAGMLLPFLLHGSLHSQERKIYPAMVAFAFLGLAIHATLDGVALLSPVLAESGKAQEHVGHHGPAHEEHDHDEARHRPEDHSAEDHGTGAPHDHAQQSAALLALAVILHRLPMGVAVWWLAVPILGRRAAILLLGILIGATVLGFTIAGRVLVDFSMPGIAIFEATIAGMLLHVIMGHEHGHGAHEHGHGEYAHGHGAHEPAPALDPVGEDTPWISALGALTGVALVGGLCLVHPMEQRFAEELSFGEAFTTLSIYLAPLFLLGAVLEAILQGVFHMRRSIRAEIALPTVLVAFGLLRWQWTLLYLVGVAWILLIGLRAARLREAGLRGASIGPGSGFSLRRLATHLERSTHADGVWAWVGIGMTALLEPILRIQPSAAVPDWLGPGFAMVVAVLLGAICSRNALFGVVLAFFFLHIGWSHATVLGFLLAGVAARVVRGLCIPAKPAIFTCLGLVPLIWAAGFIPAGAGVDFHRLAAKDDVGWQLAALAILALMLAAGLFSRGFRGFLQPVFGVPAESPEEARIDQEKTTPLEPALG
ncbi:MAG: hypothetical protein AAF657_14585 [Acidobacteriota bacterium]